MIRTLRPGDPIPDSAPRRLKNGSGYMRLRWSVGDGNYVEAYEHRVIAGLPACEVHHKNGDKTDNRPENLEVISASDHRKHHANERRRMDPHQALEMYRSGVSTPKIAKFFGVNNATVFRALDKVGVSFRSAGSYWEKDIDLDAIRKLHTSGMSTYRIATVLGCSQGNVQRRVTLLGLTPHRQHGGRRAAHEAKK